MNIKKKNRLTRLAGDQRFIPGIYNYCDRWCERCPQTSHCLNFAISEEEFADPETRDIRNEAFWKKLSEVFSDTIELLMEEAKIRDIDLEALDTEGSDRDLDKSVVTAESQEICRLAGLYGDMVEDWFKSDDNIFFSSPALPEEALAFEEAIEVIRWYQHFIYVKLHRAVRGEWVEEEKEFEEFPRDSEGSAKAALIGIDRSISAWGTVYAHDLLHKDNILRFTSFLDFLREAVQKTFPDARAFIRPGFDKIDLNS